MPDEHLVVVHLMIWMRIKHDSLQKTDEQDEEQFLHLFSIFTIFRFLRFSLISTLSLTIKI